MGITVVAAIPRCTNPQAPKSMPNGEDKNWVRLCAALDGFFVRYGHWPSRIRIPASALEDFRHLFTPESLHQLLDRFEVVIDSDHFAAEADGGRRYDYMVESFPYSRPAIPAQVWLGVHPDAAQRKAPGQERADGDRYERYDITLAGRQLFWLRPAEVMREVMRFLVYDLGFEPSTLERHAGRRLWRSVSDEAVANALEHRTFASPDGRVESLADVIRDASGGHVELHSDAGWGDYRQLLYRLEVLLPFGSISWKPSGVLTKETVIRKLGLDSTPGSRRLSRWHEPPTDLPRPLENCYWASAEPLLVGEYPFARESDEGLAKLRGLVEFGVACFVDLTSAQEDLNRYSVVDEALQARRPEHHWHPITPDGTPSAVEMSMVLDTIDDALRRGLTIYLHDRGGLGRSAMVLGCHLTRRGLSGEEAIQMVRVLASVMPKSQGRRIPQSPAQERMVRTWSEQDPDAAHG